MGEQILSPHHPLLQQVVQYFWVLEGQASGPEDITLIYPEGCTEIIFSFAGPTRWVRGDQILSLHGSVFSPIRTGYFNVCPQEEVAYLAIRFWPESIPLLQIPVNELANQAIALDDVLDKSLRSMFAPLYNMDNMPGRIAYLEQVLLKWVMQQTYRLPEEIIHALKLFQRTNGEISVHQVAEQCGTYNRKLERDFLRYLGVSPKTYSRIIRFNQTVYFLQHNTSFDITEAVYQIGYADQAHFIRECREFTGLTPGGLFRLLSA